jgi:tRNA(fMet)-specific endonuclease VapC
MRKGGGRATASLRSSTELYCFDTDVLSHVLRRNPPLALIRRLAIVPADQQFTTAITAGELLYGAARRGSPGLTERVRDLVATALTVLPFDLAAADVYGPLRADLEAAGKRLDEPDLRISSIALAHGLILVTGNVRHFGRVPGLNVENWLGSSSQDQ